MKTTLLLFSSTSWLGLPVRHLLNGTPNRKPSVIGASQAFMNPQAGTCTPPGRRLLDSITKAQFTHHLNAGYDSEYFKVEVPGHLDPATYSWAWDPGSKTTVPQGQGCSHGAFRFLSPTSSGKRWFSQDVIWSIRDRTAVVTERTSRMMFTKRVQLLWLLGLLKLGPEWRGIARLTLRPPSEAVCGRPRATGLKCTASTSETF